MRRAEEADLGLLAGLWDEYALEIAPHRRTPWSWTWDDVAGRLRQGAAFLAETDAEPAGFVLASRSRPDIGHVDDLYVRPEHRGGGLAATLLLHVATAFRERGVAHVSLDVDLGNEPARALYERLGFTPYAQRLAAGVVALEEACRQAARPRRSRRSDR